MELTTYPDPPEADLYPEIHCTRCLRPVDDTVYGTILYEPAPDPRVVGCAGKTLCRRCYVALELWLRIRI